MPHVVTPKVLQLLTTGSVHLEHVDDDGNVRGRVLDHDRATGEYFANVSRSGWDGELSCDCVYGSADSPCAHATTAFLVTQRIA